MEVLYLHNRLLIRKFKCLLKLPGQFAKNSYHGLAKLKHKADCLVDLRSDTVTRPTNGMRDAMRNAVVGDDVIREDETVTKLESLMAQLAGKEAGLFVTSGTMGNLLSVLSHCSHRGAEVLMSHKCHIHCCEQGNIAQFGRVYPNILPTQADGTISLKDIKSAIHCDDPHFTSTELICIENTHGGIGGKVLPLPWIDQVSSLANQNGIYLHMDGARLFNASVASGEPISRILSGVHSAMICLSKSLGAPVGSVVVGSKDFIVRARRLRKGLGGGWRQAGILAAAGLYALGHNIDRLKDDHENAKLIAKGINELNSPDFYIKMEDVHTNMIFFHLNPAIISSEDLARKFSEVTEEERRTLGHTTSILCYPYSATFLRMLTHLDVSREQTIAAVAKMKFVIQNALQRP